MAVAGTDEAEAENAQEVMEEAEFNQPLDGAEGPGEETGTEVLAESEAEADEQGITAAELAVESVPPADEIELPELEAEEKEIGTEE